MKNLSKVSECTKCKHLHTQKNYIEMSLFFCCRKYNNRICSGIIVIMQKECSWHGITRICLYITEFFLLSSMVKVLLDTV
jgi:hypothetical protein